MSVNISKFGISKSGKEIKLFEIENTNGMLLKVTDLGATITSLFVPDRNGNLADVVLGLAESKFYEEHNWDACGTVIGRNANRISNHSFTLNGIKYNLTDNNFGNNLHSGNDFYFRRIWEHEIIEEENKVIFSLTSPDMDQGMPGNLEVSVSYTLTEDNSLLIEYNGISDKDTIFNLTNHSYFNLNGHDSGNIDEHYLKINADYVTYDDNDDFSKLQNHSVDCTGFDFRELSLIRDHLKNNHSEIVKCGGFDHNFCLNGFDGEVNEALVLESRSSGRRLTVYTDRPGIQVYTANHMNNNHTAKEKAHYKERSGIAFETQFYPDAINHPDFPSPVIKAFVPAYSCTVYKFTNIED